MADKYTTDQKRAGLDRAADQMAKNSKGKISHQQAKDRLRPVLERMDRKGK